VFEVLCLQEVRDYVCVEPASDDVLFSEIYHSLIHSQSLDTLLGLDDTYGTDMQKLLTERDRNIATIEKRFITSSCFCIHSDSK